MTLAVSNVVLLPWFLTRRDVSGRVGWLPSAGIGLLSGGLAAAGIAAIVAISGVRGLAAIVLASVLVVVATAIYVQTRPSGHSRRAVVARA